MKIQPTFSERLLAIEMELDGLISGAGGIDGLKLLDILSKLSEPDQKTAVAACLKVIEQFEYTHDEHTPKREISKLRLVAGGKG